MKVTWTGIAKRVNVVYYTKRHKQHPILQPTLKIPGTLPAFFHTIPVLFYHSFQATKPPGLFLKSAPTLEHSSFSRPLSITESVAGRRLVLLGTYAVTLQFSVLQNNPLLHPHSETGHIRLRQHSLHHKFRKLRLYTFAGACR